MDIAMNDFEYERRFFCRALPPELDDGEPMLIVQSYYVHDGNYALRVRLQTHGVRIDMNADTDPIAVLRQYRDRFTEAFVTVKGPSVGGTRYEAEREIDARIAAELVMRGGCPIIKNRFSAWIGPVTNLQIPSFCVTEITDQARFSNDGLASRPFSQWAADFDAELHRDGPRFQTQFGRNRMGL